MTDPFISVVVPTYNRASQLPVALESVINQSASASSYEIIVVDNNSTDRTAEVAGRFARDHADRVRRILETRQGVAYARQTGIDAARGDVLAFFDDDVRVSCDWIATIQRWFREHPDVECLGGKVLPSWSSPPPSWLTPSHWSPLALQDFGEEPVVLSLANPRGLISANLACRRSVFERLGGFSPRFQRVKDGIGSLEDDEWIRRFWKAGGRAVYVPELVVFADVPVSRLTRAYHRRWHQGHGRFYALLRAEEMEQSSVGAPLGVPAHLYRSAATDAAKWCSAVLLRRSDVAFLHEVRLRFFAGFFSQRVRERGGTLAWLLPSPG
jgi:glycosyltransferase involved in cell wall biosynthesis